MSLIAKHKLEMGSDFPYDAGAEFWEAEVSRMPPPAKDWAHAAARGVIAYLTDRRSIKSALENPGLDHEIRAEIVTSLAEIIRVAAELGRGMR